MFLLKYLVVGIIIFWIVRSISNRQPDPLNRRPPQSNIPKDEPDEKKPPKDQLGDYIDYEEID